MSRSTLRSARTGGRVAPLFGLPAAGIVALLLYLPFLWTTYVSFTDFNGLGTPVWSGLTNYKAMFSDPDLVGALTNTLLWVVGMVTLPVVLGLVIAVLTYGHRWGTWLRLPFLLPYAISGVAVGVIWGFVLQPDGALGQVLGFLGLPGAHTGWLQAGPGNTLMMIVATSWQAAGVNALLFVIGLQSIPAEPLEAARLDGAEGFKLFLHQLWPQLRPITTVVVGLSIVGSLKTFDVVWVMTQGGPGTSSETLALSMYKETFVLNNYGQGAAIALFLSLVTFAASVLYLRYQLADGDSR
ncbi:carbohydrate ABC transporter permease [Kribbella catacumbae]|uniref:carbohydrate ABC transporter permease n=1 Tax=Kribbella catacumbae TaxID=460086 RepID=UPI00037DF5EB|nr:sugar ABC transporter permease [Kribbella catacumbae]